MREDLIERLREGCVLHPKRWSGDTHDDLGGSIKEAATDALMAEAAAALEAAREDAERLGWLATDGCIEGFVGVEYDIYEYACGVAEESGREEPNESDMLGGLRRLVDAARKEARNDR